MPELILMKKNEEIWRMRLKKETFIGYIIIGNIILKEINSEYCFKKNYKYNQLLLENISEENINYKYNLENYKYGIWIKTNFISIYNLYGFNSEYFLQGFISCCINFNVDFRNYIYGYVFDKYKNNYILDSFNQLSNNNFVIYSPDIDDMYIEKITDENLINLLHPDY